MASVLNGSFASPLANADISAVSDDGLLSRVYNGMSSLSMFVTFLLMLVAYDQCELPILNASVKEPVADVGHSQIHLEQGIDCWTSMEDALYWTVSAEREPEDG